ncbi:MAG: hypothetical protein J6Y08_00670 [Clostridiales bacterium]|nr:hypothetical protein [Clostridiales bacterium]
MLKDKKRMPAMLVGIVMFVTGAGLGFTGCGEDPKWKEKAQAALPAEFNEASMGQIYVDGDVLTFPMKVEDLLGSGWKYPTNIKDIDKETLDSNYTSGTIEMNTDSSKKVSIKATNIEAETLDLKKCYIEQIIFDAESGNVMLPGGITIGQEFADESAFTAVIPSTISKAEDEDGKICYNGFFDSADGYACKMTMLLTQKSGKLVLSQVRFESDFLPDAISVLSAELSTVIKRDYVEYAKYTSQDCAAYADKSRTYLINSIVGLYGYMFDELSEAQLTKLDDYLLLITKDAEWTFADNKDGTLTVEFSYPNLEEQMDLAYDTSYAAYIELYGESDGLWADPVLLDMFIEDLVAQAGTTTIKNDGTFTFVMEDNSISDDDFSDLSFSILGLYEFIVYMKTEA